MMSRVLLMNIAAEIQKVKKGLGFEFENWNPPLMQLGVYPTSLRSYWYIPNTELQMMIQYFNHPEVQLNAKMAHIVYTGTHLELQVAVEYKHKYKYWAQRDVLLFKKMPYSKGALEHLYDRMLRGLEEYQPMKRFEEVWLMQ